MSTRGDESRRRILQAIPLLTGESGPAPTLDEIADEVGLSRSATYKHLSLLRDAGKVVLVRRFSGWRVA